MDGISDDGSMAISIIAFIGSVFSPWYSWSGRKNPHNHCSLNVVTYGKRGRWTMTERKEKSIGLDANNFQIGPSNICWNGKSLDINFKEITIPHLDSLEGTISIYPEYITDIEVLLKPDGTHIWRPFAPISRIKVETNKKGWKWEGNAYLDGNFGTRALEQDFSYWTWSRLPCKEGSIAFYDANRRKGKPLSVSLKFYSDGLVKEMIAPPETQLSRSLWAVQRKTRSDIDYKPKQIKHMLDAPFYTRSGIKTKIYGEEMIGVHEALDLNLEAEFFNLLIPFNLDVSTRLESSELSRSLFSPKTQAIELFKLAQEQFETAISFDTDYLTAKENLFFTEIALNFLDDKVIKTDVNTLLSSTNSCKNCINGQLLVSQNKLNKAKRVFKDGSSSCLFCEINTDFKKKKTLKEFTNDDNKTIFSTELVNGVDMYCSDFRESNCDDYYKLSLSKICKSKINGINVFKLKRRLKGITSCISIQEIASNNINYKNSLDVYVGDDVSKILDNHNDLRLVKTLKKEYITVVNEKLTFLIINGKVNKWFLFDDNY